MRKAPFIQLLKILLWIAFGISIIIFILNEEKTLWSYVLTLSISLLYSLGYGLSNGYLNEYLNKKFSWVTETRKRTFWAIVGGILVNVVVTYSLNYVNYVLIQGMDVSMFFSSKMNATHWVYLNITFLIVLFLHARDFIMAMKQNTTQKVVEQQIIASSANAQFESLKNQLDPHFLFNSLNVLGALIEENPERAQDFTASLAKIYRYILEQKNLEVVSLKEEIEFAKTYIELLKYRFEDSLQFNIDLKPEQLEGYVVPLSLQLLLENCTKHNAGTEAHPLFIKIYKNNNNLMIENNIQPRNSNEKSSGIGLPNIVQRYKLLTQRNVLIEKTEKTFKVQIPILTEKINIMEPSETKNANSYDKALRRVKELKGFYGNLIAYCCVISFFAIINFLSTPNELWFYWPAIGWGLGLAIHGFNTFGVGKNWEEKKIRQFMEKEKQEQTWR